MLFVTILGRNYSISTEYARRRKPKRGAVQQYSRTGITGLGILLRQDSNLVGRLEDYRHSRAVRSVCVPTDLNHL